MKRCSKKGAKLREGTRGYYLYEEALIDGFEVGTCYSCNKSIITVMSSISGPLNITKRGRHNCKLRT